MHIFAYDLASTQVLRHQATISKNSLLLDIFLGVTPCSLVDMY